MKIIFLQLVAIFPPCVVAFSPPTTIQSISLGVNPGTSTAPQQSSSTALNMGDDSDMNSNFMRFNRQKRQADVTDRVVELRRPLGIVLKEDKDGNVYVDAVAPKGNAARTGSVKEGDTVTMCSATFGDDMWSCRGAGLTRVLAAIRVRAGPTVKLVFERTGEKEKKWGKTSKSLEKAEEARKRAQKKKDDLLSELEEDEKKIKRGFFGLF